MDYLHTLTCEKLVADYAMERLGSLVSGFKNFGQNTVTFIL